MAEDLTALAQFVGDMKNRAIFVFSAAFALLLSARFAIASSLDKAESKMTDSTATILSAVGSPKFVLPDGSVHPVKIYSELHPGTTIVTGMDDQVRIVIAGINSKLSIRPYTSLKLTTMKRHGRDTKTVLELSTGNVFGKVKKINAHSSYIIRVGDAFASIHGKAFAARSEPHENAKPRATFLSIAGTIGVFATVNDLGDCVTLHDGQQCSPSDRPLEASFIDQRAFDAFKGLIASLEDYYIGDYIHPSPVNITILDPFGGGGTPNPAYRNPPISQPNNQWPSAPPSDRH